MIAVGFKIDQAKSLFFDSQRILRALDAAERKVLSRFGAFVRTRARSSIRKRKRSAPPGKPPSSHTGLLKKFIYFVFDPEEHSVIIGPARLNQAIGDAPAALEHGGRSRVTSGGRRNKHVARTVYVRPRPYMQPAFQKEMEKLPKLWKDSIR